MSKASAMANAAGVSFEELGAYIAVVSETTRQDARTIGTALNSMMARLMSVKKTGFNEEDETKVNDIAKALKSVNVELTDGQGGWRSMSVIFREVAEKWSTLTDKEKGYLATTIGGTRQQNTFRIIMEDLAKGADGMEDTISRINELYEGAVNSAGTAADKYAIYMESIAAAQDNFRASMERIYSWFVSSGIIKGFYDLGSSIADAINFILRGGDVQVDYTKTKATIQSNIDSIKDLRDEYIALSNTNNRTETQDKRMTEIVNQLAISHSLLKDELFDTNGAFVGQETAVQKVNEAYEKQIKILKRVQSAEARQNIKSNRESVRDSMGSFTNDRGAVAFAKNMDTAQSQIRSMLPGLTENESWSYLFKQMKELSLYATRFGPEEMVSRFGNSTDGSSVQDRIKALLVSIYGTDADWKEIYNYLDDIKINNDNIYETLSNLELFNLSQVFDEKKDELKDFLNEYVKLIENDDDYEKLSSKAKENIGSFLDSFIEGLSEEDLSEENFDKLERDFQVALNTFYDELVRISVDTTKNLDNYFEGRYSNSKTPDVIKSYMESIYEAIQEGDRLKDYNPQTIQTEIDELITAYNNAIAKSFGDNKSAKATAEIYFNNLAKGLGEKYQIKVPFEFVLSDETNAEVTKSQVEKARDELFASIRDAMAKERIELAKETGFQDTINNIGGKLDRKQYENVINNFSIMSEDYRKALMEAYPWLARMISLLENGKIEEAMKIWNDGLEDAKNNFKFLTEEERKYQEYLLEDRKKSLEKNDYSEWIGILDRGFMNAQSEEAFEEQYQWIKNQNDDLESSFYDTWTSIFGFIGSTFDEQGKLKVSLEQAQANYASWQGSRTTQKQKSANEEAIKAKRKQDLERDAENGYVVERGKLLSYLNAGNDEFTNALKQLSSTGNVDLVTRPFISSFDVIKQGYEDCFEDGFDEAINSISTFFNSTSSNQTYAISVTPVLPDGTVLERETFDAYMDKLLSFNSLDEALAYDKANRSLITTGADAAESGGIDKAIAIVEARAEQMHNIHALMLESDLDPSMYTNFKKGLEELGELGVLDDFYNQYAGLKEIIVEADAEIATHGNVTAETMAKIREALFSNEAAWNKYYESITKNPALDPDHGIGYLGDIQNILRDKDWGVQNLYAVYQTANDEERKFIDQYVNLDKLASGAETSRQAILKLHQAMYELQTELDSESTGGVSDYEKRIQYEEDALEGYAREAQELKDIILNVEDGQDPVENLLVRMQELESDGILEEMFEQFGSLEEAYVNLKNAWLNDDVDVGSYLDPFINSLYQQGEAFDKVAEKARKNAEASVGYIDRQLDLLRQWQTAISNGTYEEFYDALDKRQKEWLENSTEGFEDFISGVMEANEYLENLRSQEYELSYGKAESRGKIFAGATNIVSSTQSSDNSFVKELDKADKQVDKLYKAIESYYMVTEKVKMSTKETEQAYKNIANFTGLSEEQLKTDQGMILAFNEIQSAAQQTVTFTEMVLTQLQQTGDIDFGNKNWRAQLDALAGDATYANQKLATLAQTLLNIPNVKNIDVYVNQHGGVNLGTGGDNIISQVASGVKGLWQRAADWVKGLANSGKTTVQQESKSSGSRGGGGGGGSSKKSEDNLKSEIEKMIDLMKQIQEFSEFRQSVFSALRTQYENKNELQGVILYYNKEKEEIEANNKVLQENLDKIEALLPNQQALVASLATTDENYKDASSDLEKLQSAHMEYTKALIENETKLNEYNKAIKEVYKKIRDMEIDLRNTILQAIEDREEREKSMLEARINMENEVFKIIKKRYEDERDEIIDTAKERQNALKEEASLLDENLKKRKEAAEQEEKQAELLQLQQQLARISADPSRRAEQQKLQKQIQKLQKDLAWDEAEREVEAQKESLNEQVENLDDYIEYVQRYYEDLFEHPKKLLEEVEEIMQKTDDEILEWLKANNEEYAVSSQSAQRQIVASWEDTLRTMHGELQLYWDEVEYIIEQGEDYIIQFLMENSADYRAAGKLQAEAYVDEWKEQLENLRLAYKQVYDEFQFYDSYNTIRLDESGGSSGDNGGGNSNGGNNNSSKSTKTTNDSTTLQILNPTALAKTMSSASNGIVSAVGTVAKAAVSAVSNLPKSIASLATTAVTAVASSDLVQKAIKAAQSGTTISSSGKVTDAKGYKNVKATVASLPKITKPNGYATGGESFDTELAILHGSPTRPERVLNETQTALFDMLVQDLHTISRIRTSSSSITGWDGSGTAYGNTFGDIVINVQSLSSDSDYDEMADKVMDVINTRINRGMAVGGIRRTR